MKNLSLIILILLLSFFDGFSQNKPLVVGNLEGNKYALLQWTTENGLPQSNVHSIAQTPEGYLWFATFDGLVRYDGNRLTYFDPGTRSKITSSFIISLVVDKEGYLWVSSNKQIFKIKNDRIEIVWESKKPVSPWRISSFGSSILAWNNNTIRVIKNDSITQLLNTDNYINKVEIDKHNHIYFSFFKEGLFCFHNNKLDTLFTHQKIVGLYKDGDLNVVACIEKKNKVNHYRLSPDKVTQKKDSYGWMNTRIIKNSFIKSKGAEIYLSKGELLIVKNGTTEKIDSKYGLGGSENQTAFIDAENNIWIGTTTDGLFMLYPKVLKTIKAESFGLKILGGNMVYQDRDNKLYMDTKYKGPVIFDEENQSVNLIISNKFAWTMIKDQGDTLWIGNINGYISNVAPNKSTNKDLNHPNYPANGIYSFFIDSKNRFWIGTRKGPAFKSYKNPYELIPEGKSLSPCYQFMEDSKGKIWLCSGNGLGIFDGANFKILTTKDGLPTNDIRTIYEDDAGTYWIGTSKFGLLRYKDGKMFHFPYQDGRINPNVWTIVEDDFGYFWMGSNQGLYKINKQQLNDFADGLTQTFNAYKYTVLDGLANPEFNSRTQNKGFKATDGRLWFSNIGGAVVVNPKEVFNKINLHALFIEEIFIDKKKITFDSVIVLNSDQSHIKINWALPSYYQTGSLNFQVMLENKDAEWIDMNNARSISFSDLSPNTYTFKVRLIGSNKEASFKLIVKSYFWETPWFQIISIILITLLIAYTAYRIRLKSIYQKNNVNTLKNELAQLEIKAMESKLNPHFIFNCLNSIQALYNSNRLKDANKYMADFSDLLRIIIHHAQVNKVSLKEEINMLEKYIPLEQLQFDEPFDYQINIAPEINLNTTYIPSVILQILVENAIKHGLKNHKNTAPLLKIKILNPSGKLVIEIIDNGEGFRKRKNNGRNAHKSIGLQLLSERIELINQLEGLKINLSHTDLVDSQNKVIGCMAKVEFKEIKHIN